LKSLQVLNDVPNLKVENGVVSLSSNKQQITFTVLDNLGKPFKNAKSVTVAL
jgi:hypothetical protein